MVTCWNGTSRLIDEKSLTAWILRDVECAESTVCQWRNSLKSCSTPKEYSSLVESDLYFQPISVVVGKRYL